VPYTAWKFKPDGSLKKPENGICIEKHVCGDAARNLLVSDYANVHFSTPDPTNPDNLRRPTTRRRRNADGTGRAVAEVRAESRQFHARPQRRSAAERRGNRRRLRRRQHDFDQLHRSVEVQLPATGSVRLVRRRAKPAQPSQRPGPAIRSQYEPVFGLRGEVPLPVLPPDASGNPQKALYQDHEHCDTINIYDCLTATLGFPLGTVLAETFAFRDGSKEDLVETRLLIKRALKDGTPSWSVSRTNGRPTPTGHRVANLKIEGATKAVTWNYDDPDADVKDASGKRSTTRVPPITMGSPTSAPVCSATTATTAKRAPRRSPEGTQISTRITIMAPAPAY